jgi:hypothetical protein
VGRPVIGPFERRHHLRVQVVPGRSQVAARLRTGSPVVVLNLSQDGILVETPVRLLPGRRVDLLVRSGSNEEVRHCLVVHSRVGFISGGADLRYRAGLSHVPGSNYPVQGGDGRGGKEILAARGPGDQQDSVSGLGGAAQSDGMQVGKGTSP